MTLTPNIDQALKKDLNQNFKAHCLQLLVFLRNKMIEKQQDGLFCTFLSSIQNGCDSFKRISDLFLFFFLSTYSTKKRYINYCKDSPEKIAETTRLLIYLKLLHSPKLILPNVKKLLFLLGMCGQCVNRNFISYQKVHFFYKQLGSGLSPQSCLYCCLMVAQQCD